METDHQQGRAQKQSSLSAQTVAQHRNLGVAAVSTLLMSGLCDPSALVRGGDAGGELRSPLRLHHVLPEPRHLTFIRSVRCPLTDTKPADRPLPLPSNSPGLAQPKRFMHPARWGSYCSPVRSDRLRHDQRANPSFTKVITVLARRQSKSSRNTVLFVGVSDAGKTAILSSVSRQIATRYPVGGNQTQTSFESMVQLAFHEQPPTHASLQTNSSLITLPSAKQPIQALDIPGHPRIRVQYRDHFNDAKAVVFVADASTVSRNGAAVAEYVLFSSYSLPFLHGLIGALHYPQIFASDITLIHVNPALPVPSSAYHPCAQVRPPRVYHIIIQHTSRPAGH